jgi:hypothetical protein
LVTKKREKRKQMEKSRQAKMWIKREENERRSVNERFCWTFKNSNLCRNCCFLCFF